jgi:hypothetical protein
MAGAAEIMRIVPDSYSAGMTTLGSVVADFLWLTMVGSVAADFPWMTVVDSVAADLVWMTIVVCCLLATHLGKEYCQHASWTRHAELVFVSVLQENSKRGTGHEEPEWMPVMDNMVYWEGVAPDFAGAAAA